MDERSKGISALHERIPFLPRDVLTLPVRNITVEELARIIEEKSASRATVTPSVTARL